MILREIADEHLLKKEDEYALFIREKFPIEWEMAMNGRI
jgi:hypothetical protein